jgi:hypothetical protein
MAAPSAGYNIPVSIGFGTTTTSGSQNGPFSVTGDMVFGGGYSSPWTSQPTSQDFTQTPTTTVTPTTAEGNASVGVSSGPGGSNGGNPTSPGIGLSLSTILLVGAIGGAVYFLFKHEKKG